MRLHIEVLPLTESPNGKPVIFIGPRVAAPPAKKFVLPVEAGYTLEKVWQLIEERYERNYLSEQQAQFFTIKKLTDAYDCDVDVSDTVEGIFDGETDRAKFMLKVVQGFIDREASFNPNSTLRPFSAQKRLRELQQLGGNKRRRLNDLPQGVPGEDFHRDLPLPSRESNDIGADQVEHLFETARAEGRRSPSGSQASGSVICVEESQHAATNARNRGFEQLPKIESPELGSQPIRNAPHVNERSDSGNFLKPSMPASRLRTSQENVAGNLPSHPSVPSSQSTEAVGQHSSSDEEDTAAIQDTVHVDDSEEDEPHSVNMGDILIKNSPLPPNPFASGIADTNISNDGDSNAFNAGVTRADVYDRIESPTRDAPAQRLTKRLKTYGRHSRAPKLMQLEPQESQIIQPPSPSAQGTRVSGSVLPHVKAASSIQSDMRLEDAVRSPSKRGRSPMHAAKKLAFIRERRLSRGEIPDINKSPKAISRKGDNRQQSSFSNQAVETSEDALASKKPSKDSHDLSETGRTSTSDGSQPQSSNALNNTDSSQPVEDTIDATLPNISKKGTARASDKWELKKKEREEIERKREASIQRQIRANDFRKTAAAKKEYFGQVEANERERSKSKDYPRSSMLNGTTSPAESEQIDSRQSVLVDQQSTKPSESASKSTETSTASSKVTEGTAQKLFHESPVHPDIIALKKRIADNKARRDSASTGSSERRKTSKIACTEETPRRSVSFSMDLDAQESPIQARKPAKAASPIGILRKPLEHPTNAPTGRAGNTQDANAHVSRERSSSQSAQPVPTQSVVPLPENMRSLLANGTPGSSRSNAARVLDHVAIPSVQTPKDMKSKASTLATPNAGSSRSKSAESKNSHMPANRFRQSITPTITPAMQQTLLRFQPDKGKRKVNEKSPALVPTTDQVAYSVPSESDGSDDPIEDSGTEEPKAGPSVTVKQKKALLKQRDGDAAQRKRTKASLEGTNATKAREESKERALKLVQPHVNGHKSSSSQHSEEVDEQSTDNTQSKVPEGEKEVTQNPESSNSSAKSVKCLNSSSSEAPSEVDSERDVRKQTSSSGSPLNDTCHIQQIQRETQESLDRSTSPSRRRSPKATSNAVVPPAPNTQNESDVDNLDDLYDPREMEVIEVPSRDTDQSSSNSSDSDGSDSDSDPEEGSAKSDVSRARSTWKSTSRSVGTPRPPPRLLSHTPTPESSDDESAWPKVQLLPGRKAPDANSDGPSDGVSGSPSESAVGSDSESDSGSDENSDAESDAEIPSSPPEFNPSAQLKKSKKPPNSSPTVDIPATSQSLPQASAVRNAPPPALSQNSHAARGTGPKYAATPTTIAMQSSQPARPAPPSRYPTLQEELDRARATAAKRKQEATRPANNLAIMNLSKLKKGNSVVNLSDSNDDDDSDDESEKSSSDDEKSGKRDPGLLSSVKKWFG